MYISSSEHQTNSDVYEYIGNIYSRLWDEMVVKKSLEMQCYVLSNTTSSKLTTLDQIKKSHEFQAIYTENVPIEKSVNSIVYENIKEINKIWKNSTFYQIYYLDEKSHNIPQFQHIAVGGTFDQLHNGHRKLLTFAASLTDNLLTIGITADILLVNKTNSQLITSFIDRKKLVQQFIYHLKPSLVVNVVELFDGFGPTITDENINAIIVSSETIAGAFKINEIRQTKNMNNLSILVTRRSDGATLSSSFIRNSIVNSY